MAPATENSRVETRSGARSAGLLSDHAAHSKRRTSGDISAHQKGAQQRAPDDCAAHQLAADAAWSRQRLATDPTAATRSLHQVAVPCDESDQVASGRAVDEPREASGATLRAVDDDNNVVQRCKQGDRSAFVLLFRRHRLDVARLIQRMLGPGADVEDLVQDVFLQVHKSIGAFRGSARFSTWLYRVTVNVVLMHRRALRSRPSFASDADEFEAVDVEPLPDERAARNARVRAFYRLLDKLSEKKRTVFVLHEVQGLSPAQISELVSAPVLTVRTRLFYARREVVQLLADEPELRVLAASQLVRGEQQRSTEEPA